jgi:predicted Fe-S protein YdhL (DUF1289 family)
MATATSISSPCNRVCVVHPTLQICIGCGRSLDEIASWIALSDGERSRIMAQLPARLSAMNNAKDAAKDDAKAAPARA